MRNNINIGEILTKAWQITWKFKVLWIFGILASCSGGSRGNANFPNGSNNGGGNGGSGSSELPDAFRQFGQMDSEQAVRAFFDQYMGLILGVILLMCVLWLVFYFVGVMGRTGAWSFGAVLQNFSFDLSKIPLFPLRSLRVRHQTRTQASLSSASR